LAKNIEIVDNGKQWGWRAIERRRQWVTGREDKRTVRKGQEKAEKMGKGCDL
jgi:hypothetical protein